MNPREFCREPGYASAVILTFNFDPLFFERITLPELWAGGTGDVLVVADPQQTREALPRWKGQLRNMGRRYQLVTPATTGAYHPKAILRFGSERAAVWIGSGNLTAGGWGGNRELACSWVVGPDHPDSGKWLVHFVDQLSQWCPRGTGHDVVERIRESTWYLATSRQETTSNPPVLWSHGSVSLADQISARWSGQSFRKARVLTGSTDREGRFLSWLNQTFGVDDVEVALDQNRASFNAEKIEELSFTKRILHLAGSARLHAKLVWLSGPEGEAVLVGSANCSSAAWLIPPSAGGNVEAMCVFDEVGTSEFGPVLSVFQSEMTPAILNTGRVEENVNAGTGISFPQPSAVDWEPNTGELSVLFTSPLSSDVAVTFQQGASRIGLSPSGHDQSLWLGLLAGLQAGPETAFGNVILHAGGGNQEVIDVWINNLSELRHSARGRHIVSTLQSFKSSSSTPAEQQRMLADLQRISSALLSEPESFPDPLARRSAPPDPQDSESEEDASAIDPDQFVRSLDDLSPSESPRHVMHSALGLSLSGVMRALFQPDDDEVSSEVAAADDLDDESDREPVKPNGTAGHRGEQKGEEGVLERNRKRLAGEMSTFLERLKSTEFAETCTATQMTQAVAYPLAVAALGHRGGWVESSVAEDWAVQAFDVLFRQEYRSIKKGIGLLAVTRTRYEEAGALDAFTAAVGDGTLWLALLAGLAKLSWSGKKERFVKALVLRWVFCSRDLLASTRAGRLRGLIANVEGQNLLPSLLTEASISFRLLDQLEKELSNHGDEILDSQIRAKTVHEIDDLFWCSQAGWAEGRSPGRAGKAYTFRIYSHSRAKELKVVGTHWVNVSNAANERESIQKALSEIMDGRFSKNSC